MPKFLKISEGPSAFKTFCPNHLESILKVHKKAKVTAEFTFTQRVRVEVKKRWKREKAFKKSYVLWYTDEIELKNQFDVLKAAEIAKNLKQTTNFATFEILFSTK